MKLYKYKKEFEDLVSNTVKYTKYPKIVIYKDYFVTMLLKDIVNEVPDIVFKGGTSLSKAWHVIHRFSEDIDLAMTNKPGKHIRNNINKKILNIIEKYGFLDLNEKKYNNKEFRKFIVEIPEYEKDNEIKKDIIIESAFQLESYPTEVKKVQSYITDFLESINRIDLIKKYELEGFNINVQSLERTFIDKVFAICDYNLQNKIETHARHIYDLYKLYPYIDYNKTKRLISEIREIRKHKNDQKTFKFDVCISAQDGININDELKKIIDSKIYYNDYNHNTKRFLHKDDYTSYEEAITVLEKIIESNLFIEKEINSLDELIKESKNMKENETSKKIFNKDLML